MPPKPTTMPATWGLAQPPPEQERRDQRLGDGDGAGEHARQGRVDVLLRQGKERERKREPDDREEEEAGPVAPFDRVPGGGHDRQRGRPEREPEGGDQPGREVVEADIDEEEFRAKDPNHQRQQEPIPESEGARVAAFRRLQEAGPGPLPAVL